ncbi:MAG: hypothetical protein V3S30_02935 [Thermoanaerobaculia bacterium]
MMASLRRRLLLLAVAAVSLLVGMWAGLSRLGWWVPELATHHPMIHGPLMVGGFLGIVIGLERSIALGKGWGYFAPAAAAGGAIIAIIRPNPRLAALAFTLASTVLLLVFIALLRRRCDLAGLVMTSGSVCWLLGNLSWVADRSIPQLLVWWIAFPLLMIVGERLELSGVIGLSRLARSLFAIALAPLAVGLALLTVEIDMALRLCGLSFLAVGIWLLRFDLARRTIRFAGAHRYTAMSLLLGYLWLVGSGALLLAVGADLSGLRYDAFVHALFLGFVLSMIFGHVPILVPVISGFHLLFSRFFYLPLVMLHVSLVIRIAADMAEWLPGRSWGALSNVVALLAFFGVTLRAVRTSVLAARESGPAKSMSGTSGGGGS